MHLVGFTIEIYYDAQPYERQTWCNIIAKIRKVTQMLKNYIFRSFTLSTSCIFAFTADVNRQSVTQII